jgi:hypothetical protein
MIDPSPMEMELVEIFELTLTKVLVSLRYNKSI